MKTSFIIGWVCLFVACIMGDSIIQQSAGITSTQGGWLFALTHPSGTDVTVLSSIPIIGQAASLITMVWSYILNLIELIFLWFPSIWNGTWLWVYYFVCLPVAIGFVVSIVFILRGVHNA